MGRVAVDFGTLRRGLQSGGRTGWALSKVIFPVTLIVAFVKETSVMDVIVSVTAPVTQAVGLPGEAALPLVIGVFVNIYAAIGALLSLSLTVKEVFILAMMLSFAHNLIVETALSKRVGVSVWVTASIRLALAGIAGVVIHHVWAGGGGPAGVGTGIDAAVTGGSAAVTFASGWELAVHALRTALAGVAQLLAIVVPLMVAIQFLKELQFLAWLSRRMRPVTRLLGLSETSATSLMAGVLFGLAFGAGVIIENARDGRLGKRDLYLLIVFLVSCHSVVEDTLIFVPLGIPVLPLLFIRLCVAFALTMLTARIWERMLTARRGGSAAAAVGGAGGDRAGQA